MLFYYVRHGEPNYALDALTPLGAKQAEAVGKRLARSGMDRIFSSPQGRAKATAAPLCEILGIEPTLLEWTTETLAYADFQVPTTIEEKKDTWCFADPIYREILNRGDVLSLGKEWFTHPLLADTPENGTHFERGVRRITEESNRFFASLGYEKVTDGQGWRVIRNNPERVALFAHGGFGLAFLSILLEIPYPIFSTRVDLGHSGVSVIRFPDAEPGTVIYPKLMQLSDTSHIFADGLPMRYNGKYGI